MEGKFCSNCNQRLDENAYICKHCGSVNSGADGGQAKASDEKRLGKGGLSFIIAVIILVVIAIILMFK